MSYMAWIIWSFGVLCGFIGLIGHLIVVTNAFRDHALKGILAALIPFYMLYYLFSSLKHPHQNYLTFAIMGGYLLMNLTVQIGFQLYTS